MKRLFVTLSLALFVAGSALATGASELVCDKTGTPVDECCCVMQDGKMVCTLTGEVVDSCCCSVD